MYEAYSEQEEANFVAKCHHHQGRSKYIAVLYRSNAQHELEEFIETNHFYVIYGEQGSTKLEIKM